MVTFLKAILSRYWSQILGLIAIGGMGVFIWFQGVQMDSLKNEVDEYKNKAEKSDIRYKQCSDQLQSLNKRIDDLSSSSEFFKDRVDDLNNRIKDFIDSEEGSSNVDEIDNSETPNSCEQVRDFLKNNIGNIKW